MRETLEPITLIQPLCGLGEDYEPDVAFSYRTVSITDQAMVGKKLAVFQTTADAQQNAARCGHINPQHHMGTIDQFKDIARITCRAAVILVDADNNIIRSWPV